jgi:hypothetical protein
MSRGYNVSYLTLALAINALLPARVLFVYLFTYTACML